MTIAKHFGLGLILTLALAQIATAASVYDDDFADGTVGSQWSTVTDNPSHLTVAEQHGRLELLAGAGGASTDDALYLSNFRLSTASDFDIQLDYTFIGYNTVGPVGTALALDFGVGKDTEGFDSAAIGQGWSTQDIFGSSVTGYGATVAYRTNDVETTAVTTPFNSQTGTFEISYDSAGDDLTLRRVGSGITYTLLDTVRGQWNASDLLVSFGGRGSGFETMSGEGWVDNFTIISGTVVPEPARLALLGLLLPIASRRAVRRPTASV